MARSSRRTAAAVALAWAAAAGAAASAAACGNDGAAAPEPVFAGAYQLEAVGGQPLPILINCFLLSCDTLKAGRVEVMSRGRIRDIYVYGRTGRLVSTEVDTLISAYVASGRDVWVTRDRFGGGTFGGHVDTAAVDPQGRLTITIHWFDRKGARMPLLYRPD